jgi:MurNAc alpha-1-phosphate uridylyltransferase
MNTDQVSKPANATIPEKAMLLAAGLGTRMKPLTEKRPKPLIEVQGKALIDHALDALVRVGVKEAVVNVHYHAEQIIKHLANRQDIRITISDERAELLDSGGGIVKALPHLGSKPFYLMNADSFWVEGFQPNLVRMAQGWDSEKMDILLLLAGMANAVGFNSKGDFDMDPDGRLSRRNEGHVVPFGYAGAAIINPQVFADAPDGRFSLNRQFDTAIEAERLFGIRLEGLWLHVGTPEAIPQAESAIAASAA